MKYCEATFKTKRWKTREVMIGNIGVGGNNPIRIQSMTTSNTRDIASTINQIKRLSDVGCEIARITVQGKKEAEACEGIKNGLVQSNYMIPIVADIHFYPPAAMLVAEYVDKVRVNPGNFVDRRAVFKSIEYTSATYAAEVAKIDEVFGPLVDKCKRLKRAMRIGTNHGSLSDRIMNRYGDTPFGMVESALEFARVCRSRDYHDFMFSMKASNTKVMMQAYRLLAAEMIKLGWDYPLHLGVTEAGDGEDGRVKSSMGIGSLLLDGLGDTIRVSLTEDPWEEIDPCKRIIKLTNSYEGKGIPSFKELHRNISEISKRAVTIKPPLHPNGTVMLECMIDEIPLDTKADLLYIKDIPSGSISKIAGLTVVTQTKGIPGTLEMTKLALFENSPVVLIEDESDYANLNHLIFQAPSPLMIVINLFGTKHHLGRYFFEWIQAHKLDIPVILTADYSVSPEDLVIHAAAEFGSLLCDGLGDGICMKTEQLAFNILQGSRMRFEKTEFIACPGCGRTLFNLQEVTQKIRSKTSHLAGVKIAIMGCIVNGPGEMADADFGYVGSRSDKIDLYVGKSCVERNIDFTVADERLIALIKSHGKWVEPQCSTISAKL